MATTTTSSTQLTHTAISVFGAVLVAAPSLLSTFSSILPASDVAAVTALLAALNGVYHLFFAPATA